MAKDDHAVVVGINSYPRLRDLRGPESDAAAMARWLADPKGGDVPPAQICTVLSSAYGKPTHPALARPMLDDVRSELDRLCTDAGPGLKLGRRLYLYLAGHGFSPQIDEASLLMANAAKQTLPFLPGVQYANAFRGSTIFDEIVLVMDCCRTHFQKPPLVELGLPDITVKGADAPFFFGFATKATFEARGRKDESGTWRGDFTRAFVEGISQPGATSESVEKYVLGRMPELAGDGQFVEPDFRFKKSLVFGSKSGASAELTHGTVEIQLVSPDPTQTVRVLDGDENVIAEALMTGAVWSPDLSRGLYEVERSDRPGDRSGFRVHASGITHVQI